MFKAVHKAASNQAKIPLWMLGKIKMKIRKDYLALSRWLQFNAYIESINPHGRTIPKLELFITFAEKKLSGIAEKSCFKFVAPEYLGRKTMRCAPRTKPPCHGPYIYDGSSRRLRIESCVACTDSATRLSVPVLRSRLATYAFTVRSSMPSSSAISRFDRAFMIRFKT